MPRALAASRSIPGSGLRRGARIAVTGWVLCVVPLLTITVGYLLICLPQINRALWLATVQQARLAGTAIGGHHYAIAALDAIGVALEALALPARATRGHPFSYRPYAYRIDDVWQL